MVKATALKKELPLHLMLLPAIILVLVFSYGPMVGVVMAFQDYIPGSGWYVFGSKLIGLDNFKYVLTYNPSRVLWNTVYIAGLKIITGLIIPISIALMLNEVRKAWIKRSIQTLIYLPNFLSWVILSGVLIDILSPQKGIVSQILSWFNVGCPFFLADNNWFPWVLVFSNIWKEAGFATIIYLAALSSIDITLYEAAIVDGAGYMKQLLHVTLPGMMSVIVIMGVLSLGNVLNAGFEQVFNLYSPVVYQSGDILDTFVYRIGIQDAQYGVSAAVGLFKSIVSFGFISTSYYLAYKFADYRLF